MGEVVNSLLAVFAHPDDETSVAALLTTYAKKGTDVYLVSITSGQKGVKRTTLSGDALGAAREEELRCAARHLGIHEPIFFGMQDQGISTPAAIETAAAHLREVIERLQPDVLITWGPDGISGHPDHRAACNIVTEVFQRRTLLRHKPKKLYYVLFPESRIALLPPPFDSMSLHPVGDQFITTEVDCRAGLDEAAAAVRCHQTQWDNERMERFGALHREAMGGRVFLRLALSETPLQPGHRETGLFE